MQDERFRPRVVYEPSDPSVPPVCHRLQRIHSALVVLHFPAAATMSDSYALDIFPSPDPLANAKPNTDTSTVRDFAGTPDGSWDDDSVSEVDSEGDTEQVDDDDLSSGSEPGHSTDHETQQLPIGQPPCQEEQKQPEEQKHQEEKHPEESADELDEFIDQTRAISLEWKEKMDAAKADTEARRNAVLPNRGTATDAESTALGALQSETEDRRSYIRKQAQQHPKSAVACGTVATGVTLLVLVCAHSDAALITKLQLHTDLVC
jgi:hypothetical protein